MGYFADVNVVAFNVVIGGYILSGTVPGCQHADHFGALPYSNCQINIFRSLITVRNPGVVELCGSGTTLVQGIL